ncbi:DUF11 domain-containing protein [Parafrankia discariae]|uniref:DUF11 domain-containing protein n=1 Tax=Parafrankia discariae TaxID=365528 RepID=UPI00037EE151|nr:DUF11 domain-containing protein [Parafrankia discariae]
MTVVGAVAALAVFVTVSSALAATVRPGQLRLTTNSVVSGAQGVGLSLVYTAPSGAVPGTVGVRVPAGFSTPQTGSASAEGFLSTSSACAQFQITGTAAQPDGSTAVTVATNCAAGQTGTISYAGVTVPTAPGSYAFPGTFTPVGAAPIPFPTTDTITVKAGVLATLAISPTTATIAPGATRNYTVQGFDAAGNPLSNLGAYLTIAPDGSCTQSTCTATVPGAHTVTAKAKGLTATATLTVVGSSDADLSIAQTVSTATPAYGSAVTFTTTVTNTSATVTSTGVTATVPVPAGLASPAAAPSGSTSYNPSTGTWTVGSLAPGASVTLALDGLAGDVSLGAQTVTASVTADTPDANSANNTASASATPRPAAIGVVITADPGNPPPDNVDIGVPGTVSWTATPVNADSPAAATPPGTIFWTCESVSGNPCPVVPALLPGSDIRVLTFDRGQFSGVDTIVIAALFVPDGATTDYVPDPVFATTTFTLTNNGAG